MKFLSLLLLAFVSLTAVELQAQGGSNLQSSTDASGFEDVPDDIKKQISVFFNGMIAGEVEPSFEKLLSNSPVKRKTKSLSSLIEKTALSIELYGNMMAYEPVSTEFVTSSYLRVRYISLHSRMPMRWIFTFYNSPDQGWVITNIKYDDQTEMLFYDGE